MKSTLQFPLTATAVGSKEFPTRTICRIPFYQTSIFRVRCAETAPRLEAKCGSKRKRQSRLVSGLEGCESPDRSSGPAANQIEGAQIKFPALQLSFNYFYRCLY